MGWDSSTKLMTKPIGMGDISQAVNNSSLDLGTLITNGLINQWSKMKPVAFPYAEPDRTQPVSAYGKNLWWWKGHPTQQVVSAGLVIGNYTTVDQCVWFTVCGIKYLGFRSLTDALRAFNPAGNYYNGASNNPLAQNFSYVRPTGGINVEPFRMFDFDGYWGDIDYRIIPDYGTETGTKYVEVKDGSPNNKVRCSVMSYASSNTGPNGFSFNDLFAETGSAGFTVILGTLSGSTLTPIALSTVITESDEFFKEVEIDLNVSQAWGKTIIGIYCAYISYNGEPYYVPIMQSNNLSYCGNTPISVANNRRVYNSWHVERSTTPYYAMSFTQKQNYGSGFAWNTVASMTSFMTSGAINRWYLKIELPKDTATYSVGYNSFELELSGQFRNSRGSMEIVNYVVTSAETRFVLKNNEVTTSADWGTSETVTVTSGSGTQTAYLAIYTLFANRNACEVIYGGTVWRVTLRVKSGSTEKYTVVYGALSGSEMLNINVPAVTE